MTGQYIKNRTSQSKIFKCLEGCEEALLRARMARTKTKMLKD
jgi:hypothetical protein